MASLDEVAHLTEQLREKLPSPTQEFDANLSMGPKCFIVDDESSRHLSRPVSSSFASFTSSSKVLQRNGAGEVMESNGRTDDDRVIQHRSDPSEVTEEGVAGDVFIVEEYCGNTSTSEDEDDHSNGALKEYHGDENILKAAVMGSATTIGVANVENSTGVHIGNVTYVLGSINVTQVLQNNTTTQNVFISADKGGDQTVHRANKLRIIPRRDWLAQPPLETPEPLNRPVNMVIISHTASESGATMEENVNLLRRIQDLHVGFRKWNDIAYNFLVGMDGNVYEGRGWDAVGSHTFGYNQLSLGVSFVGCFMRSLPTEKAFAACLSLLQEAVDSGHLTPDYKLLAHCQLSPTESPGKALYEVLRSWPHWAPTP